MRKILLLTAAFILILTGALLAQQPVQLPHGDRPDPIDFKINPNASTNGVTKDVLFYEDWTSGDFGDWTIQGDGQDNWYIATTNQAGGEVPEAQFYYGPVFNPGTTRLVSPVINTTGYSEIGLSFMHVLDLWSGGGGFWIAVETTSDGGTTWNEVWQLYWETTDDYYATEVLSVTTPDVGSENFQFCFKYWENSDLLDWWKIDNITLGDALSYDAGVMSMGGISGTHYEGDPIDVFATVKNLGAQTVTFDVKMEILEGSTLVFESTQTVTDLAMGEDAVVNFDTWTSVQGAYTVTITALLAGDENPANDAMSDDLVIFSNDYYCIPSANCFYGDGLDDFAFAGIENYGSGCSPNGFGSFLGMTAEVELGYTYTAQMMTLYGNQYVTIWVDFNKDMQFGADEQILTDHLLLNSGELYDVDITIPAGAETGETYMRVGVNYSDASSSDPCATFTYGEWEDYSINVTGEVINYNAGVTGVDMPFYAVAGDITPKATVVNLGIQTVSFPVTCTIDGGYSSTVQVTDLANGESLEVEFDTWAATPGSYDVEVATALTGDEIPANDMMTAHTGIVSFLAEKRVVGEEGTGTWCGFCVRGIVYMEYMALTYPESWIGIGVHNGDPMVVPAYDDGLNFPWFPDGYIDRAVEVDPQDFEEAYLARLAEISPASIEITEKSYNEATGELSFTVSSEFAVDVTGYRFLGVLIENFVTGTGSDWAQYNYYSGGGLGPMGGFENLPNPIPAEDMVYMDVARALLGDINGMEGSLPETILDGEVHSYEFTTTISEEWNIENIEVVGMLINTNASSTGVIVNGIKEHALGGVGTEEIASAQSNLQVYPNPAADQVTIKAGSAIQSLRVYNHLGQLIHQGTGDSKTMTFNTSSLQSGLYFFHVEDNEGVQVKSVIIK